MRNLLRAARECAGRVRERNTAAARWIASDAMRELSAYRVEQGPTLKHGSGGRSLIGVFFGAACGLRTRGCSVPGSADDTVVELPTGISA